MTAASAAIAMCGCDGIVVLQRMVTAMKPECDSGLTHSHGPVRAGLCPEMLCMHVVTALRLCDMHCAGKRCRCGCGDDAGVTVCRMGAAVELWLHALAVTGAPIWQWTCVMV